MELDESIARLGRKLDEWLSENLSTFTSSHNSSAKALSSGAELIRELNALRADGLNAISALLNRQDAVPDGERVAALVRAFEFAAKLQAALNDEVSDVEGANKIVLLMNEIANRLDLVEPGRIALVPLLTHADPRVCASAGAYLLIAGLVPDRVIPILREIEEEADASSASFTAHWALLDWEIKQRPQ